MAHLTAQQRDDIIPDPQELAEYAQELRAIRARQRTEKFFSFVNNDDPWKGIDTTQHRM